MCTPHVCTASPGAERQQRDGRARLAAPAPCTEIVIHLHCHAEGMQEVSKRSSAIINNSPSTQQSFGSIFKPWLRSLPFPSSSLNPHSRSLLFACHHDSGTLGFKVKGEAAVHLPCRKFHPGKPFAFPSTDGVGSEDPLLSSAGLYMGWGHGTGVSPPSTLRGQLLHLLTTSQKPPPHPKLKFPSFSHIGVTERHGLSRRSSPRSQGLLCPCTNPPTARQALAET